MKIKIKFGFVFTNYNNSEFTKLAIESIDFNNEILDYKVVVVDNNSSTNHVETLTTLDSRIDQLHLILQSENVGYFKGLDIGMKYLRNKFPDINYMVIGNNDLIFPSDFHNLVIQNINILQKYAVISPDIITDLGEHQNPHVIKKISIFREIIYDIYYLNYILAGVVKKVAQFTKRFTDRNDEKQHGIAQTIYQGHGSCYLLGTLFFQNFDELWAPTFLMYEEFFLSYQLQQKKLKIYYEPAIKVIHTGHSSIGKIPSKKIWELSKHAHKEYRKYIRIWK